jgi:hypothetical protein
MSTAPHVRLVLRNPGELIAAIPTLLGFRPTDSVIVVTYTGDTDRRCLAAVLRSDIPDPAAVDDWVSQLCVAVANQSATAVVVVLLGGAPTVIPASATSATDGPVDRLGSDLPGRHLLDVLAAGLERTGTMVGDALWAASVDARTWRCYRDPVRCGVIPDPASLPVLTALTVAGVVTYGSREELAAVLAPHPAEVLALRAALVADLPPIDPDRDARFLTDVVAQVQAGRATESVLDDATIARLAHVLGHGRLRDVALGLCVGSRAEAAERVWTVLVRGTPRALVAHPACLLGVCAYLRGQGSLAAIAFEMACEVDPEHPTAGHLRLALNLGLHPSEVRRALEVSLADAGHPIGDTIHSGHIDGCSIHVERSE